MVIATTGTWLMTGAKVSGLGTGELLGVSCAIVFSIHLIAINTLVPRDDPWRMTGGQFLAAGALLLAMSSTTQLGLQAISPRLFWRLIEEKEIWGNLLPSLLFSAVLSFSVMTIYQPRVDPARAALIYLMEPIFATAYAFAARGHSPGGLGLIGAALILSANILVELLAREPSAPAPAPR